MYILSSLCTSRDIFYKRCVNTSYMSKSDDWITCLKIIEYKDVQDGILLFWKYKFKYNYFRKILVIIGTN